MYIAITCHYMDTWSVHKLWIRAVARWEILGKTLKVVLLQTCFVIEDFGSNRTGIAIGNAWRLLVLKVRWDFILDGLLIQNVANIQSVDAFIGEFGTRKRAVLVSVGSPTLTAYKKCMATPYVQSMEKYYFGRIFYSRYCLSSKRRCP